MSSYILDPFRAVARLFKHRRSHMVEVSLKADTAAAQENLKRAVIGAIRGIVASAEAHEARAERYRYALLLIEGGADDPVRIAATALDSTASI